MNRSPNDLSKLAAELKDRELKLSPSITSPNYQLFGGDDEYNSTKYNPPMKLKNPSGALEISSTDPAFPQSPYACASPYWGAFGVSANSASGRSRSDSSPSMNPSSTAHSAAENADHQRSHLHSSPQISSSFRNSNQAPILIAPNPQSLRAATRPADRPNPYRHDSMNSLTSYESAPNSVALSQDGFSDSLTPLPARRKRKTPPASVHEGEIVLSGEISHEEQILIQLADHEQLPWKEVAQRFNELTGKNMKVPALQMRKKRLRERLRIWTDLEERALVLAWEDNKNATWDTIATEMLKHGCTEKWSKEAVQKRWYELHPYHGSMPTDNSRSLMPMGVRVEATGWPDRGLQMPRRPQESNDTALYSSTSASTVEHIMSRALSIIDPELPTPYSHPHPHRPQDHWNG
ncbi:hypothetical protein B7494_g1 [Chlorociboria aeruginascens]|nr:hypothetical protein B7494_g1 [Chlorociboria aeruginascens]